MIEMVRRRPLITGFAALFLLFTMLSSFVIVPETRQSKIFSVTQPSITMFSSRSRRCTGERVGLGRGRSTPGAAGGREQRVAVGPQSVHRRSAR